jgi:glycosyltransferase involved in cell wall biosynthesis
VRASDLRIAVSNALVGHWRQRYGYTGEAHVVIPCTLGRTHLDDRGDCGERRKAMGFGPDDVVLAYSGSTAGWQSFALLERLLGQVLAGQPQVKVLFLCPPDPAIDALAANWLGRALRMWVQPAEVHDVLAACDAALLVREDTVTNRVASPTKFAEYLACGLPVIISAHIGDFSEVVARERLGIVYREDGRLPVLARPSREERERLRGFAMAHYTKAAYEAGYRKVLQVLAD